MTKTRSGDEEDNVCVEHYDEEKTNAMFANLGEEYQKCSDRSLEAWGEVTKMYRIKEGWSASVNILDKSLLHIMFNTLFRLVTKTSILLPNCKCFSGDVVINCNFMNVYTYKEKELPWVEAARKNPDFDIPCMVYYERFGKHMAYYHPVGELGGVIYGEWRDDRDKTTVPPAYWIYLHDIPAPNTSSDDVNTDKNYL